MMTLSGAALEAPWKAAFMFMEEEFPNFPAPPPPWKSEQWKQIEEIICSYGYSLADLYRLFLRQIRVRQTRGYGIGIYLHPVPRKILEIDYREGEGVELLFVTDKINERPQKLNEVEDLGNKDTIQVYPIRETTMMRKSFIIVHRLSSTDVSLLAPKHKSLNLSFLSDDCYTPSSCGGLLCFNKTRKIGNAVEIFLYNPTTQESKRLYPPPPCHTNVMHVGFGFDVKSNDYKVIRFRQTCYYGTPYAFGDDVFDISTEEIELYSLKEDSWRKISNSGRNISYGTGEISLLALPPTYVNGSLYWKAYESSAPEYVASFNLTDETFYGFPLPPTNMPSLHTDYDILDCNGSLGVIMYPRSKNCKPRPFMLWVLVNGTTSWNKVFHIFLPGVESALGFSKNGNLLFLESKKESLLVYDLESRKLCQPQLYDLTPTLGKSKNFEISPNPKWMKFIPYVESTISLRDGIPKEEEDIPFISYVESSISLSDSIDEVEDDDEDEDEDDDDDDEDEDEVEVSSEEEFVDVELLRNIWG